MFFLFFRLWCLALRLLVKDLFLMQEEQEINCEREGLPQYLTLPYQTTNWSSYIKPLLRDLVNKNYNSSSDIVKLLRLISFYSYTHRSQTHRYEIRTQEAQLECLQELYGEQLPNIFQRIAQEVLDRENEPPKIPFIYAQK